MQSGYETLYQQTVDYPVPIFMSEVRRHFSKTRNSSSNQNELVDWLQPARTPPLHRPGRHLRPNVRRLVRRDNLRMDPRVKSIRPRGLRKLRRQRGR